MVTLGPKVSASQFNPKVVGDLQNPVTNIRTQRLTFSDDSEMQSAASVDANKTLSGSLNATANTVTSAGHGLLNHTRVRFSNLGGGLGIATNTDYYVANRTNDTFQLKATTTTTTYSTVVESITADSTSTVTFTALGNMLNSAHSVGIRADNEVTISSGSANVISLIGDGVQLHTFGLVNNVLTFGAGNVDIQGTLRLNNVIFTPRPTPVYFSVQMASTAASGGTTGHFTFNYLNEIQTAVPSNVNNIGTRGLANSAWDTSSILSSGGTDQDNFNTNGFVVPRTGIYKLDCYQSIRGSSNNCGNAWLAAYRNPDISTAAYEYDATTCLARSIEDESNDANNDTRSESIVWLGQLTQNDVIKFHIKCDNGFALTSAHKGCFTIISVD